MATSQHPADPSANSAHSFSGQNEATYCKFFSSVHGCLALRISTRLQRSFLTEEDKNTTKKYVVKHNLITGVYLMTVMETTTCFGLYCPSSGCLGNLRASYMHARARGVEISTYAQLDKPLLRFSLSNYAYVEISTPRARACI